MAGITVLQRDDDLRPTIVRANEKGHWVIVEKFDSVQDREDGLREMPEDELTILDE